MVLSGFIPAVVVLGALLLKNKGSRQLKGAFKDNKKAHFLVIGFFMLSTLEFIVLGFHESVFNQARYGFFLYAAAAFLIAMLISAFFQSRHKGRSGSTVMRLVYVLFAISLVSMVSLYVLITQYRPLFATGKDSQVLMQGIDAARLLNLTNCGIISNAWVPLKYYGMEAYGPFGYNKTTQKYAAIVFPQSGVNPSFVNTANATESFNYSNFTIYIMKDGAC